MTTTPVEILLVEDDPNDVRLTLHALQAHGLETRTFVARNGAEALEFLFHTGPHASRAGCPDPKLVLLDLKLPKVDGIEVLQRLKSDPRTRAIPVVMLTSSCEDRDIRECYQLGVNSYIVKAVDSGQFRETVRQLGFYWRLVNQSPTLGGPYDQ